MQARQLGEMSAVQAQMSMVIGAAYMGAIAEGCAQTYPALRSDVNAMYDSLKIDAAKRNELSLALGSCIDKRSAPDEDGCRSLIGQINVPVSEESLSAFFDAPAALPGMKMIKRCGEE